MRAARYDRLRAHLLVGHGARALEELVATLRGAASPASSTCAAFPARGAIRSSGARRWPASLPAHGVAYAWLPRSAGGASAGPAPSPNPSWQVEAFRDYADYIDAARVRRRRSAALSRWPRDAPTAFMCAETHWSQCHRRILSDKLWALAPRGRST